MDENKEKIEQLLKVAQKILLISRNTLIVHLRFLDSAISKLVLKPDIIETIGTNGKEIIYNPEYVVKLYKEEKELPTRAYIHMLFHCIYQHFFVGKDINIPYWNLACDIAVEQCIRELDIQSINIKKDIMQQYEMQQLKKKIKILTAERIYKYFLDTQPSEIDLLRLQALFWQDDHFLWYQYEVDVQVGQGEGDGNSDGKGNDNKQNRKEIPISAQQLSEMWKKVSEEMETCLTTFLKERGDNAGSLMQNLKEVNREKYDYTEFLKKFSVMGEVMKVNDDEFDYIFYTYGLNHYGKMPLIEPLEYKEHKAIKEFVIAIDTSGSVEGEIVQTFLQKTYNILKNEESFFTKINLHIIQCDAEIQEAVKITSQEEFDNYLKTMQIRGLGGTDFRPVFQYVDELIANKEFTHLKGMIYFTDGYGVFPKQKPNYETAFVFIEEDYPNLDELPPWAIKLILKKDEI